MALDLNGIHNVGEFYSTHYLTALLEGDLKDTLKRWSAREKDKGPKAPSKQLAALANRFFQAQGRAAGTTDLENRLGSARDFHAHLLAALGYERSPGVETIADGRVVPVLGTEELAGRPYLWIVEAPFASREDDADPFGEAPHASQVPDEVGNVDLAGNSWQDLLDGPLLRHDQAPRWIMLLAGSDAFLIDRDKWPQGKYLHFELGELMGRRQATALRALAGLLHREVLLPEGGQSLHDTLDENSHKHAFAVSTDLKYGARRAIELIANEAIRYVREVRKEKIFGDDELARDLTRESLIYLYRLLFLFYVEARGAELEVVPMKSEAYREGYSLETLRDLELVPLTSVQAREGHYIDSSLRKLFRLIHLGHGYGERELEYERGASTDFVISGLRSPLFDEDRTPILKGVKLRNLVMQEVLQLLSLSKESRRSTRGRISYAQLGINQLGAVYEGLLSYTGFFAQEDLYEIKAAKEMDDPEARTYFVPSAKIDEYEEEEKVRDGRGRPIVHEKATYLFRLAGRDREKSASYYTPEVLTKCLTMYTLKERLGESGEQGALKADEILELTVCEPAMGSGAFLNEAVNQLAEAYLERKQAELGKAIPADEYQAELQRVKYRIAVSNCYGVDLNPLAAELGKVSLWLNILQPGVRAPYFDQRIAVGNSLIGGRREVFDGADLQKKGGKKAENWLSMVPKRVKLGEKRPKGSVYHFLVPDLGMAPFDRDKVVKELEPENAKLIKEWRKEICKPFTKEEVETLVRLSDRIDELWEQHVAMRRRILRETRQAIQGWPEKEENCETPEWIPGVEECEEKTRELEMGTAPGRQLSAVMDYWCALWFWPIQRAEFLPTRDEWLSEIEEMLHAGVDAATGESARFHTARYVTLRERFHHWEVRFAELFADQGGFDVILGNPPWIKLDWEEAGVLGDLEPKVGLRKMSAKQTADLRRETLSEDTRRGLYLEEFVSVEGGQTYLNAKQAYPDLVGMQTNLYKCFLTRAWGLLRHDGAVGLFHHPGMFDDPKGARLRRALLPRLRLAARFQNKLYLFADILHTRPFALSVMSTPGPTGFHMLSNLFHPRTLDASFTHDDSGPTPGIKDVRSGTWDLRGHRRRVVEVDDEAAALFAKLYDTPGTSPLEARLPVVHSREILDVLRRFAGSPRKLGDHRDQYHATEHFHETDQQKDGTIRRETVFPDGISEWVLSGPQFYVATPFARSPNEGCKSHLDYTTIDLVDIPDDYLPRTNYVPACDPEEYRRRTPQWNGRPLTEFYRHVHRRMVAPTGERTLVSAIIPPGVAHINTVVSMAFSELRVLATMSGLMSSLVYDFFFKSTGKADIYGEGLGILPVLEAEVLGSPVRARSLRLNCLSTAYDALWKRVFEPGWVGDSFTRNEPRLSSWDHLRPAWTHDTPLRTPYERRQALVELDALAALALGLTADELCLIYRVQFPVLHQNERETYYDQRGRIVFTVNMTQASLGLSRKHWKQVEDAQAGDELPGFAEGYVPPFDRCDRETEMRQAYEHFEDIV